MIELCGYSLSSVIQFAYNFYLNVLVVRSHPIDIIQLITTLALVGITAWYAWHTRRMADIMSKNFELSISPMLHVKKARGSSSFDSANAEMEITNVGSYICYIKNVNAILYVQDTPHQRIVNTLHLGEIQLSPKMEPFKITIGAKRADFESFGIDLASNRYKFGTTLRVDMEMEVSGMDRNFRKRSDNVW